MISNGIIGGFQKNKSQKIVRQFHHRMVASSYGCPRNECQIEGFRGFRRKIFENLIRFRSNRRWGGGLQHPQIMAIIRVGHAQT